MTTHLSPAALDHLREALADYTETDPAVIAGLLERVRAEGLTDALRASLVALCDAQIALGEQRLEEANQAHAALEAQERDATAEEHASIPSLLARADADMTRLEQETSAATAALERQFFGSVERDLTATEDQEADAIREQLRQPRA